MNTKIASAMKNAEPNTADSAFSFKNYWQASQSGLSIEQNFMSVAGNCSSTGAAAGAAGADAKPLVAPEDTAFN